MVALLQLFRSHRRSSLLLLGLTLAAAASDAAVVVLVLPLLRSLVAGQTSVATASPSTSVWWFVALLVAGGLKTALHLCRVHATAKFQWQVRQDWANQLMEQLLHGDYLETARQKLGETVDTLLIKTREGANCMWSLLEATAAGLHLVVLLSLLAVLHWPLAVVVTSLALVVAIAGWPFRHRFTTLLGKQQVHWNQHCKSIATESLLGFRDVKSYGAEQQRAGLLRESLGKLSQIMIRQATIAGLPQRVGELMVIACLFIMFLLAPVLQIELSLGMVPLCGFAIVVLRRLMSLAGTAAGHGIAVATLLPNVAHVQNAIACGATATSPTDSQLPPPSESCALIARGLHFAYVEETPVLKGVEFEISANQLTLVVGASGAGKSTLADLLTGFVTPTAGSLTVGGTELAEIDQRAWRQQLGYVSQHSFLFHATIRENLLLGSPEADEAALEAACRAANAWDFIQRLPEGLETSVGERGISFSGGERQRIVLARAIVRQPRLYLFDEPTAGLDAESCHLFWQAVDSLRGDHTVVVIAHHAPSDLQPDAVLEVGGGTITTHTDFSPRQKHSSHNSVRRPLVSGAFFATPHDAPTTTRT